jgi:hypothetical protein
MTTRSTLMRFTLLAATLAASMVLSATGGAYAHSGGDHDHGDHHHDGRDNDDKGPPLHGPGSSHNPIVYNPPIVYTPPIVRDHRGSGFEGVVRDHRGPNGAPGGVTVSAGGTVLPPPVVGYGGYHGHGGGHGTGLPGTGFRGDVRDHRGEPTPDNGSNLCVGHLCL